MGSVIDLFLPLALAYIMFSVGVGLTYSDFRRIGAAPRDFLVGLLCQVFVLPLAGFVVVLAAGAVPEIAMGVMLIMAAPGGPTSNLFTRLSQGDVALSVSLTVVMSLLCVLTIPLIVGLSYSVFFDEGAVGDIAFGALALRLFIMATLPVLLGMTLRQFAPGVALRIEPTLLKGASLVFALVIGLAIYGQRDSLPGFFAQTGVLTIVLNLVIVGLAALIGHTLASGPRQTIAITIECGIQNGTLAIALAVSLFGGGLFVIPAITYSLFMYVSLLGAMSYFRRWAHAPS
ncbi:MAG: bile acid:sodium symporter family protein [Pseudomonadota bacterium]